MVTSEDSALRGSVVLEPEEAMVAAALWDHLDSLGTKEAEKATEHLDAALYRLEKLWDHVAFEWYVEFFTHVCLRYGEQP